MFKEFFAREFFMEIKRPTVWVFFSIMALLVFGAVASDNVSIGGSVGNVYKNAPDIITTYTLNLTLFGLLFSAAFFNNAALKDYSYKFNEILFSTPLHKSGYFFGRFFAALLLAVIPLLGVFVGFFLGAGIGLGMGWLDSDRIGPFYLSSFVNNFVLIVVPNMFFAGAVIFAVANQWKSTVISFVGAMLIMIGYILSGEILSNIDNETVAAMIDSFGIRTYSIDTKYATTIEKNTMGVSFTWLMVTNRLIWMGVGILVLALSYWKFSFAEKSEKIKKHIDKLSTDKKTNDTSEITIATPIATKLPIANISFNTATAWQHFTSFFKLNFYSIIHTATYKIMFIFSAIMLLTVFMGGFEYFGLQSYPVTYKMLDSMEGAIIIFELIVLVFFSGELVWQDRSSHISEVIDATPHNSTISLAAKALSLIFTVSSIHFFAIFVSVLYQLANGYTNVQLGVYLQMFLYSNLPLFIFWSLFLIFIQIVLDNKYIGYFVSVLFMFLLGIFYSIFEIESNMIILRGTPSMTYSDMNGFGTALEGLLWFNLYWVLFASLLIGLAGLILVRGTASSLGARIKAYRNQFTFKYKIGLGTIALLWLSTASFVFYNTQVLNTYKIDSTVEKAQARYEKTFKKYQGIAQPKITDIVYNIEIYPNERNVICKSDLTLNNKTHEFIDSVHFMVEESWNMKLTIPNSKLVFEDKELGYLIYKLNEPLAPHTTMKMSVEASYITKGFENEVSSTDIASNGTFFNNAQILPNIGYSEGFELSDKNTRKKYDLAPKEMMPKLESPCGHHCMSNYLTNGGADWVNVETFISTSADQVAIAPGTLAKTWQKDGRNFYHYKVDKPSQNFYSFMSARYEIARKKWKDVDIEIYYDKQHAYNIDLMLHAVESSLEYYTQNFGPYFHKQARIIEFPRYASFAQAFPGTMPYSEALGFITNLEDKNDNNVINAVVAHEMAHQWWAHQVIGSSMEGSTMLSESFAEYSSLMVMKKELKNDMQMKEFLKHDFDRYLRGRSSEAVKESPLYKVQNQGYIHYGKGSVILYALQDYIGEDSVNLALKEFLELYRYAEPPYPTSMDFLKILEPRVPDSLKYLITDWFKEITLYDYRLKEAKYKKLPNGKFQVDMDIEAYKMRGDSIGNETKIQFKDWVDIGVYADEEEKKLIKVQRVLFDKEKMKFSLEVDKLPLKAAIDPKRLLIERDIDDNVVRLGE